MAKKRYDTTIDLTWSGETRVDTFLGKKLIVTSADETWNGTVALWTDDIIAIVEYVLWGGSRGGVRKQWDTWNAWNKIDEADKKKIVKVSLYLKGVKFTESVDINKYLDKITIDDLELIGKEYIKYQVTINEIKLN